MTESTESRTEVLMQLEQELGVLIRRVRRVVAERAVAVHPDLPPASYLMLGYLAEHGFDLEGDHISRGMLSRAVIYGSVMGSFCCERFGVQRFRTLTREEIDARFEEFRKFTSF